MPAISTLDSDLLQRGISTTSVIADAWAAPLQQAMDEFGINTLQRVAAFLAQVAHESLRLQITHELWGPTTSQKRYERDTTQPWPESDGQASLPTYAANKLAYTLGNSEPGDGHRYAGQGPIQITGRTNFLRCGTALGYPLLANPQLLGTPLPGSRSAAWFFATHGCNALADQGGLVAIRQKINGGLNGLPETLAFNATLLQVLA